MPRWLQIIPSDHWPAVLWPSKRREPLDLVELLEGPADQLAKRLDGGGERLGVGEPLLDLLERRRVAVVHQRFVEGPVNAVEAGVERVGRVVVLIALDAPVDHGSRPPGATHAVDSGNRPRRPRLAVRDPMGSASVPNA